MKTPPRTVTKATTTASPNKETKADLAAGQNASPVKAILM